MILEHWKYDLMIWSWRSSHQGSFLLEDLLNEEQGYEKRRAFFTNQSLISEKRSSSFFILFYIKAHLIGTELHIILLISYPTNDCRLKSCWGKRRRKRWSTKYPLISD